MSISVIALALAAQAGGQEITTFHPLPSERKEKQAEQKAPGRPAGAAPQGANAPPAAVEPEVIEVLSVREIPANASVRFVPPPDERPGVGRSPPATSGDVRGAP